MIAEPAEWGTPWYHHFWPWFIVALMALSMTSALVIVWLAHHGGDPVVSANWYAEGAAINDRLARQHRALSLGLHATLDPTAVPGRLQLTLEGEAVEQLPAVRLHLSHATHAERDHTLVLDRVAPGVFEVTAPAGLSGRWYAVLEPGAVETPSAAGTALDWRMTSTFRIPSRHAITFGEDG